jgi:ornithine cyclodeaminase/alanine dehydrogenase-like protein (mu-crystallin family)
MTASGAITIDGQAVLGCVPWPAAIAALRAALVDGLDPAGQPARTAVGTAFGQLLLMPAEHGGMAGVKVLSVAPGNDALGRPRIQATYILMDSESLTPQAILDGAALTTLRTPALSAVAADALAAADAHRLVVFGAGPQAEGHVHAMCAVRPIDDVRIVSRSPGNAAALVARLAEGGVRAVVGVADDVARADVIVAATSAGSPLFDGGLVRDDAMVVAVGSHNPDRRELDSVLMGRSMVVVEDVPTALREAGDVVMAIADGALGAEDLVPLGDLVKGARPAVTANSRSGPAVFKSVGQGWQDLVIADAVYRAVQSI